MHDQFDSLRMGIFIQCDEVKIGIWCLKVKNITWNNRPSLPIRYSSPPPARHQNVFRRKIDISPDILVIRAVAAIRLRLGVVDDIELYRGVIRGVGQEPAPEIISHQTPMYLTGWIHETSS